MTRSNDDGDEKLSVHCIFIIMSMSIISHTHTRWLVNHNIFLLHFYNLNSFTNYLWTNFLFWWWRKCFIRIKMLQLNKRFAKWICHCCNKIPNNYNKTSKYYSKPADQQRREGRKKWSLTALWCPKPHIVSCRLGRVFRRSCDDVQCCRCTCAILEVKRINEMRKWSEVRDMTRTNGRNASGESMLNTGRIKVDLWE